MKKVTWEYIQGVPALYHLRIMLEESLVEAFPKAKIRRSAGWEWFGFYIPNDYFIGIYFANPLVVIFANDGDRNPTYRRELDLEQKLFFALTPDKQYQILLQFLQEAQISAPITNNEATSEE